MPGPAVPSRGPESTLRLVVGLGNPGRRYEGTRHNIGFLVADRVAGRLGAAFAETRAWSGWLARADDLFILKPATYMNLSGESVGAVARFHKIDPAGVLVVFDDVALPSGRLRLRPRGSAGGHNGLQSVIDHLGTEAVPRLRVGIGAAADAGALTGHVLGRFSPGEREAMEAAVDRAADAVACARDRGIEAAMNLFNPTPQPPSQNKP
jgi:PTH1 family peptidyl-tRNA hydrolase